MESELTLKGNEPQSLNELKIGTTVWIKYRDQGLRPFKHVIRDRVMIMTATGKISLASETIEQYLEYKEWLRNRFRKREIYLRDPILIAKEDEERRIEEAKQERKERRANKRRNT